MRAHVTYGGHFVPGPDQAYALAAGAPDCDWDVLEQFFEPSELLEAVHRKCLSHNVLSRLDRVVRQLDYPDKST